MERRLSVMDSYVYFYFIFSIKGEMMILALNKVYEWTAEELQKKYEFLYTIIKLCRKYLKKPPRLINITEEILQGDF